MRYNDNEVRTYMDISYMTHSAHYETHTMTSSVKIENRFYDTKTVHYWNLVHDIQVSPYTNYFSAGGKNSIKKIIGKSKIIVSNVQENLLYFILTNDVIKTI